MPDVDDDADTPSRDDALFDAISSLPANAEPAPEAPAEPAEAPPATEVSSTTPEPAQPADTPDKAATGRLSDLIAERQRRKALEAELAELRQRVQQQYQPQAPAAAPAKAAEPEAPTVKFEDSPAEWLRQNTEIQARRLEAHEKELQAKVTAYEEEAARERDQRRQAEYVQHLDDAYRNDWAEKAQADPTALQAHAFFASQFIGEAMAIGRTRQQAEQMLIHAERQLAYEAFTNDLSPVEFIVARARVRGWSPQAAPAAAVQLQPAVAAPAPAAAPAADQRATARASAGSKLSAASGAAAPTMPSLHDIANMPRDEYGRWRKKNPGGFEKLIGAA